MPDLKRKRSTSANFDGEDDLNYVDDGSELSSGDEALITSDVGSPDTTQTRKRGRPKQLKEEEEEPEQVESDVDASGEEKVDKFGRLLGGREYKVPTFKLPTRDETLFMFSKDPAALLGFRDSFVFLKKNTKLVKVHIDNTEKGYLVDSNLLRSTFRTREISVVTARSVFKQFGHRIVRKGKRGKDDYYYTEQVDDGEEDISEDEHTAERSHALGGAVPETATYVPVASDIGRNNLSHKPTVYDNSSNNKNRIYQAAISTRQFNASIFTYRALNPTTYDLMSNVYQIPKDKQAFIDTTPVDDSDAILEKMIPNQQQQSNLDFLKAEVDINFQ